MTQTVPKAVVTCMVVQVGAGRGTLQWKPECAGNLSALLMCGRHSMEVALSARYDAHCTRFASVFERGG